jgi:hypothetical protein
MTQILEGIYPTPGEAMDAIERLKDEGYSRSEITVIANTAIHGNFFNSMLVDTIMDSDAIYKLDEDHRSLWEKIKDGFTLGDPYEEESYTDPKYASVSTLLEGYQEEINEGGIAVLIEEEPSTPPDINDLEVNPTDVIDRTHEYDPYRRDSLL